MTYRIKQRNGNHYYHHLNLITGEANVHEAYCSEARLIKLLDMCNKEYIKDKRGCLVWPVYEKIEECTK